VARDAPIDVARREVDAFLFGTTTLHVAVDARRQSERDNHDAHDGQEVNYHRRQSPYEYGLQKIYEMVINHKGYDANRSAPAGRSPTSRAPRRLAGRGRKRMSNGVLGVRRTRSARRALRGHDGYVAPGIVRQCIGSTATRFAPTSAPSWQ
jgi:hypothetical protein